MSGSAKNTRTQLERLKPLLSVCSLDTLRKGQEMLGALIGSKYRRQALVKHHPFPDFEGVWVIPKDERRQGVILYLHGGGFTCGGVEYATGLAASIAVLTGTRVFCPIYRLAPEHPFPAALDDALESYRYLHTKGYHRILLAGESAGGGLCYSLCLKLKELGEEMPCGILAASPWVDLTASGPSYEENKHKDAAMSQQVLDYFANCYTTDRKNPLISPAFGDLSGMPESLIFAGGDEIMRSDSELLHQALQTAGCKSQLIVTPERWHAYVVYHLDEDQKDFQLIGKFLNRQLAQENKLRWLRLDNAAKIYPAARRQNWSNVFRLSATLTEKVDVPVLQSALDVTVRRFPSLAVRLRRGVFWYYLQELEHAPRIRRESSYPLTRMSRRETRNCALRVIAYENRIAIELFHSLTDGNGALIFLKSLVAEYLQQKHGIRIPPEKGVWNRLEEPAEEELEDCFPAHAGTIQAKRDEKPAWRISGTPEPDGFLHLTCLQVPVRQALDMAHSYGVSLTCFLAAAMLDALQRLQMEKVPDIRRRKPLSVLIPINLRKLWPSRTIRNFALYTTPEILPRLGHYSFPEICQIVQHWVALENTPKRMSMLVATNMAAEKMLAVKLMPLFIKNVVMKAIFNIVGERKSTLCFSNLGAVELPEIMAPYVQRMDFILGVQATSPYNCGILSYGDTLYLNMIRNIREPMLEYQFYCVLRDLGLPVEVQSNHP